MISVAPQKIDRRPAILELGRVFCGYAEAILDRGHGNAMSREIAKVHMKALAAKLPTATEDPHHNGSWLRRLRHIQVHHERMPIGFREENIAIDFLSCTRQTV